MKSFFCSREEEEGEEGEKGEEKEEEEEEEGLLDSQPSTLLLLWQRARGCSHHIKKTTALSGSGVHSSALEQTPKHKTTSSEEQRMRRYAGEEKARESIRAQLQSSPPLQRNYFYPTYKSNTSPGRKH